MAVEELTTSEVLEAFGEVHGGEVRAEGTIRPMTERNPIRIHVQRAGWKWNVVCEGMVLRWFLRAESADSYADLLARHLAPSYLMLRD